jgi:FkbM family methyltransferase
MQRLLRTLSNPRRLGELSRCKTATTEWKQLVAAYIGLPFHPFSITLKSGPFEFREKSDVATFWQVFFRNVYPLRPADRLIVDAGANIAVFSLYALLALPECRVTAVEPSSSTFARLETTLRENGVRNRCTPIRAALGSREGTTTIATGGGSQFRTTGGEGETVRLTTLAAVLPREGTIDLLKMDTEGAEYETLESADLRTLERIRRIALEYHPTSGSAHRWPALKAHLASAGFRLISEQDDGGGYGMAHMER